MLCSLTSTYLSFLLLPDQSLNSDHWTRLSLIDANDFYFQRELWGDCALALWWTQRFSYSFIVCTLPACRKGEVEAAFALRVRQSEFITYFRKPGQDINTAIMRLKRIQTCILFYDVKPCDIGLRAVFFFFFFSKRRINADRKAYKSQQSNLSRREELKDRCTAVKYTTEGKNTPQRMFRSQPMSSNNIPSFIYSLFLFFSFSFLTLKFFRIPNKAH